jgi:putative ABC transport system permease protein
VFLALRDLRAARGRFALMGGTVTLVTVMLVLLTGLADGLVDDGVSGLDALPVTHLAFTEGADATFSRSLVTADQVDALDGDGATATPLGVSFANARAAASDVAVDLALFGIDPGSFLAPQVTAGAPLDPSAPTAVLNASLADDGVRIGDQLRLPGATDVVIEVVGFADTGTYGHVAIAFLPLTTWREAVFGGADRDVASAVALQVTGEVPAAPAGLELMTRAESFVGSPGFVPEQSTLSLIQWFLYVISALVVGAFFTIWTIQRTRDIGVLKALGARNPYVVRDALAQALVVLVAATAVGTAVGVGLGAWLASGPAPFRLQTGSVATGIALLVGFALVGALVALRRVTRVDPLIALGADR